MAGSGLLNAHGDVEAPFVGELVGVAGDGIADVELDPVDLPSEGVVAWSVVL